jgi:2-keto-3-deoxy-L-fuconate dehydrogenase
MAREGATVIATDVNDAALSGMTGIAGITTRRLDVLDDSAVAALIGELPPLQVLFNCAGYVHHGTILDCSPDDWTFSMNLNARAMYVAIRAALPKMLAHHEATRQVASIVNMASISGSIKGLPNRFVYGTSRLR